MSINFIEHLYWNVLILKLIVIPINFVLFLGEFTYIELLYAFANLYIRIVHE